MAEGFTVVSRLGYPWSKLKLYQIEGSPKVYFPDKGVTYPDYDTALHANGAIDVEVRRPAAVTPTPGPTPTPTPGGGMFDKTVELGGFQVPVVALVGAALGVYFVFLSD